MRASLRFMLDLPSAGLQSAVRRLHFNFRDNRATPAEAPFGHTQLPHPLRRRGFQTACPQPLWI